MEKEMAQRLVNEAFLAREKSYCPFSGFAVGAALLSEDGTVFHGCNVEISGYGATCCAERTAMFKAVSEGHRRFTAIAVVGGKKEETVAALCPPCGICRQALSEFCSLKDFEVVLASRREHWEVYTLGQLLPLAFGPGDC